MIGRANLPFPLKRNYETPVTSWTNVKAGTNITGNQIAFTATNSGAVSAESFRFGKTGRIQLAFTTATTWPNDSNAAEGQLRVGLIPANGTVNNLRGFSFIGSYKDGADVQVMHDTTVIYTALNIATNGYTYVVELGAPNIAAYMQNNVTIYTGNVDVYTPVRVVLDNTLSTEYTWTINNIVVRGI